MIWSENGCPQRKTYPKPRSANLLALCCAFRNHRSSCEVEINRNNGQVSATGVKRFVKQAQTDDGCVKCWKHILHRSKQPFTERAEPACLNLCQNVQRAGSQLWGCSWWFKVLQGGFCKTITGRKREERNDVKYASSDRTYPNVSMPGEVRLLQGWLPITAEEL